MVKTADVPAITALTAKVGDIYWVAGAMERFKRPQATLVYPCAPPIFFGVRLC